ncbi:MAG: hypothetical protein R3D71_03035 [Rickettsiales bacterium]
MKNKEFKKNLLSWIKLEDREIITIRDPISDGYVEIKHIIPEFIGNQSFKRKLEKEMVKAREKKLHGGRNPQTNLNTSLADKLKAAMKEKAKKGNER